MRFELLLWITLPCRRASLYIVDIKQLILPTEPGDRKLGNARVTVEHIPTGEDSHDFRGNLSLYIRQATG